MPSSSSIPGLSRPSSFTHVSPPMPTSCRPRAQSWGLCVRPSTSHRHASHELRLILAVSLPSSQTALAMLDLTTSLSHPRPSSLDPHTRSFLVLRLLFPHPHTYPIRLFVPPMSTSLHAVCTQAHGPFYITSVAGHHPHMSPQHSLYFV